MRRSDPNTPGPLIEGKVGGHHGGSPLVALAEDLEEQLRTGPGQWDGAHLVSEDLQCRESVPIGGGGLWGPDCLYLDSMEQDSFDGLSHCWCKPIP